MFQPRTPWLALMLVPLAAGCSSSSKSVPTLATISGNTGLAAPVTVTFDGLGVPHFDAASDPDAAFAVGYVHARARLWEMDLYRRMARGRLAELLPPEAGSVGFDSDRFFRAVFTASAPVQVPAPGGATTTSWRIEDAILADLDDPAKPDHAVRAQLVTFLQRYADGVNRYIDDLKAGRNGATLDAQYAAIRVGPQQIASWTVQDSIAIGRLQTWQLSEGLDTELAAGELAARIAPVNPALFADLTRHAQAVNSVITPPPGAAVSTRGTTAATTAAPSPTLARYAPALSAGRALAERVRSLLLPPESRAGSNNWAVAPGKSASGHALVANDPHLGFLMPPTFHLVHVTTPARDVAGVSFPGAPLVAIGHNGKVGWGDTVVGYDVTDLYLEDVSGLPGPGAVAVRGAGTVPVTTVPEPIAVRTLDAQGREVIQTRAYAVFVVQDHGPLVPQTITPDPSNPTHATAVSMKWTGQQPTQEELAFFLLNSATSVDEGFQALANFGVGAQNFVLADVNGQIGYDPHALVPVRPWAVTDPIHPPWLPLPSDGQHEWAGFLADADLPQVPPASPPVSGFIATANNDQIGILSGGVPVRSGTPNYLYAWTDVGYRHARILERLQEKPKLAFEDMAAIQADTVSLLGRKIVPWALGLLQGRTGLSPNAQRAQALLAGWGTASGDVAAYATPTGLSGWSATSGDSGAPAAVSASAASAVFHAFYIQLASKVLDDELGQFGKSIADIPGDQIARILSALADGANASPPLATTAAGRNLCDDVRTPAVQESCADMVANALEAAVAMLGTRTGQGDPQAWRWGRIHQVRFQNPLQSLLPFDQEFSLAPLPNDGGLFTVDVASFPVRLDTDWLQRSGPNVRFSAEMAPGAIRWRAVIPGGQDEDPSSPHFADQIQAWLANQPGDQPYAPGEVQAAAQARMSFTP